MLSVGTKVRRPGSNFQDKLDNIIGASARSLSKSDSPEPPIFLHAARCASAPPDRDARHAGHAPRSRGMVRKELSQYAKSQLSGRRRQVVLGCRRHECGGIASATLTTVCHHISRRQSNGVEAGQPGGARNPTTLDRPPPLCTQGFPVQSDGGAAKLSPVVGHKHTRQEG